MNRFTIVSLFCAVLSLDVAAREIHVSNSTELWNAYKSIRLKTLTEPVDIVLAPGDYYLKTHLDPGNDFRATAECPIRYVGPEGPERACLIATKTIPAARFVASELGNGILVADIADIGITVPTEDYLTKELSRMPAPIPDLFVEGERYSTANWPNGDEWATFTRIVDKGDNPSVSYGIFGYDGDRPERWVDEPYVLIHGYFNYDWADNLIRAKAIDTTAKTIELGRATMYGVGMGNPSPRRWRAIHLLSELDAPGEYYVDFAQEKLYLIPKEPLTDDTKIEITAPEKKYKYLLRIWRTGYHTFENLVFKNSEQGAWGNYVTNVTFKNCVFENIRADAFDFNAATRVKVEGCTFTNIGGCCIKMIGGDRKTLRKSGNRVSDCTLGPAGLFMKTTCAGYSSGNSCGNIFEHNLVFDMPHNAIGGGNSNDCIYRFNIVSNCCNESDDAAAFYKGRNPSACGNVLDHNIFVDCGTNGVHGTMAVYFDDGDCGDTVSNCLFIRCGNKQQPNRTFTHGALFYNGGYAFTTFNNVFIDCTTGNRTSGNDPGGWCTDEWWRNLLATTVYNSIHVEVDVTGDVYQRRYPWLQTLLPGLPDGQRTNYLSRCTFINTPTAVSGRSHCMSDCRFLDADDGTRPFAIEKAGPRPVGQRTRPSPVVVIR